MKRKKNCIHRYYDCLYRKFQTIYKKKKLPELIGEFRVHKIESQHVKCYFKIWLWIVSIYTINEQLGTEVLKTVPFAISPKKVKYLGVSLTKHVWDL